MASLEVGQFGMVLSNILVFNSQDRFGDEYKLFLLINPEDDKPVAVVVPRQTLQPESTGKTSLFLLFWPRFKVQKDHLVSNMLSLNCK